MPETNDQVLIRKYADRSSEVAFAELVHRHIHLVYSVAFRYVGNAADAQDIAQAVFVILARKAAGLRQRTTLTGWLYETTRLTAAAFLRQRARQQIREHEAYMQSTLNEPETNPAWRQLAPVLEEAMGRLSEKERTLLALRLFDNKTAVETAALLGIRPDAAHKRTGRALEKLRQFFLRRGINSSTALIAETISANSIQAAPTGLANMISAAAMAKGAAASTSTLTLVKGAIKLMAWTKTTTAIAAAAGILLMAGTITVAVRKIQDHRTHLASRQEEHAGQQTLTGIGVALTITGHALKVMSVLPNTPAAIAGLHRGLIIQQIDGVSVLGKPLVACVAMTRGPAGSRVKLEVLDPATSETSIVELTREKIDLPVGSGNTIRAVPVSDRF